MQYAQTLAAAGDLIPKGLWGPPTNGNPPAPSPGKIMLVLETGAMLGLAPMAALQGIDVIEGRATISPQLMTGLVRAAGHKIDIVREGTITAGDFKVTVTLTRSDDGTVYRATWDPHMAARAGLCTYTRQQDGTWRVRAESKNGAARPWQAYPETMCKWRAVGDCLREGADDVLKGIAYTREEIESGETFGSISTEVVEDAVVEPSEDWAALVKAAEHDRDELNEIGNRAYAAGELSEDMRLHILRLIGALDRAASEAPAEPGAAPEPENVEVIEDADVPPAE
ncbi:hypothetical protein [Mycetocola saprophilus]|uniref:hypothetical protein n=1 Tax=Mycetocola saprophilus TaxID=76636 RepID=UPI003BF0783F